MRFRVLGKGAGPRLGGRGDGGAVGLRVTEAGEGKFSVFRFKFSAGKDTGPRIESGATVRPAVQAVDALRLSTLRPDSVQEARLAAMASICSPI
jgi:hypothetical protein